jgi:Protein of unknown function (DUF2637)
MTATPASQPSTAPVLGDWQPLPKTGAAPSDAPNPMFDKLLYGKTPSDWAIRIVLALVMTAALAVGTWSIYTLLTVVFGVPQAIAILGCGMFDGAALFFALLSQQYAVTTDSGLAPRLAMLAMICTSSWVNWQHAQLEDWGIVGSVILAAAPVIAELAFEMFHRFAHRDALRRLGRVAQALPVLGKWAWIAHPFRSRKTIDAHIRAALTEHEAVAERRHELAAERARSIVSVPASSANAQPAALSTVSAQTAERPTLTAPVERPALSPAQALNDDAHTLIVDGALTANDAQTPALTPRSERAQTNSPKAERPNASAQSAPSITERKALKERQDAITLALYKTLNGRPEWTEIRDALVSAGLESVSRPTAQRIRERVENAHPDLPRERPQTLTATK